MPWRSTSGLGSDSPTKASRTQSRRTLAELIASSNQLQPELSRVALRAPSRANPRMPRAPCKFAKAGMGLPGQSDVLAARWRARAGGGQDARWRTNAGPCAPVVLDRDPGRKRPREAVAGADPGGLAGRRAAIGVSRRWRSLGGARPASEPEQLRQNRLTHGVACGSSSSSWRGR